MGSTPIVSQTAWAKKRLRSKLGSLDAGDGRLREKFTEIGIIQFEDRADTTEEYGSLDAIVADGAG